VNAPPPLMRVAGREVRAFQVFGVAGLLAGGATGALVAAQAGHRPWFVLLLTAVAAVTFLVVAMATKILTGRENLIYYHHELAILAVTAVVTRLAGLDPLPYLDFTTLGVAVFLSSGRIGCFCAACCHGRPCRAGIRYTEAHAADGYPPGLVGVRVFPVQLVEAVLVAVLVLVGVRAVLSGAPPGAVLVGYHVGYGVARFGLEYLRGDPHRAYLAGFSHTQWTALAVLAAATVAAYRGALPYPMLCLAGLVAVAAPVLVGLLRPVWPVRRRPHRPDGA
jgi:prolipoprotein diacylglyceryltransferase